MQKITLHYTIENGGDGSASVSFYTNAEEAALAGKIEDEREPLDENVHSTDLYFDDNGKLLNPEATMAQLEYRFAEAKGEEVGEEDDSYDHYEQTRKLEKQFNAVAAKPAVKSVATNASLAGKTVVFTGKFSTMTRAEAEKAAASLGATVASAISGKADLLVVGENAGSKLEKAKGMGIAIMSEAEWNELTGGQKPSKPAAPKRPGI